MSMRFDVLTLIVRGCPAVLYPVATGEWVSGAVCGSRPRDAV